MSDTWECSVCGLEHKSKSTRDEHERVAHGIGQQSLGDWS